MLFEEFANKLYPIIGEGKPIAEFVEVLFENITTFEDEDNNLVSTRSASSFKSYYTGQNTINTFSKSIRKYLDPGRFETYIECQPEDTQIQICDEFGCYIDGINKTNVAEKITELFKEIICKASETKRSKKNKALLVEEEYQKVGANDYELLVECNSKCPICGESLLLNSNGNIKNCYRHLYILAPSDSEEKKQQIEKYLNIEKSIRIGKAENELLVCGNCFHEMQEVDMKERACRVYEIKQKLRDKNKINDIIHRESVEKGIRVILERLGELDDAPPKIETLDAHMVEKKIPQDYALRQRVLDYALTYYRFVRDIFNELQNEEILRFNKVRNEVSQVFEMLDEQGLNQRKIFESLVQWLQESTGSEDRIACEIIISFFVQNCEVFYEAPE